MKKLFILGTAILGLFAIFGLLATPLVAGTARDCDSNSVIYCGAYSTTELANKLKKGTGKSYQSGSQLTSLFAKYNIYPKDFGQLKAGRVTKDNKVYVGSKLVATNVYSMGRHKTSGSKDVPGISYPLWLRHPSESFISKSIDAFVYLNYDGTFGYAVIKSCGNIVPGHYKVKPAPTYTLTVKKWNDINGDNSRQTNEPWLSGWKFRVRGNGIDKDIVTSATGATLSGLKAGTYTVDEYNQAGWKTITNPHMSVNLNGNKTVYFGNQLIPKKASLQIIKFEDLNRNKVLDGSEKYLSGWTFKVTGPNGYKASVVTDSNGQFSLTDLEPGTYTVTEVLSTGWENTTGLTLTKSILADTSTVFTYGNRKVDQPKVPATKVKPLPVTGPEDMIFPGLASLGASGGILSWIRSRKILSKAKRR